MSKKFYPNDGRSAIPFKSVEDIADYMGKIMHDLGPIEIVGESVITQIQGQYLKIGEIK